MVATWQSTRKYNHPTIFQKCKDSLMTTISGGKHPVRQIKLVLYKWHKVVAANVCLYGLCRTGLYRDCRPKVLKYSLKINPTYKLKLWQKLVLLTYIPSKERNIIVTLKCLRTSNWTYHKNYLQYLCLSSRTIHLLDARSKCDNPIQSIDFIPCSS